MPAAAQSSSATSGFAVSTAGSLEQEKELRQFLKLARPEWLVPRRKGHSDVNRVIVKLRAIGVTDTESLFMGIERNTINGALNDHGFVPFSRETLDSIKKKRPFMQALKDAEAPHIRQIGDYAPVPQMLAKRRLATSTWSPANSSSDSRTRAAPGLGASRSDGFLRRGGSADVWENQALQSDCGLDCGSSVVTAGSSAPRLRGAQRSRRRGGSTSSLASAGYESTMRGGGSGQRADISVFFDVDGGDSAASCTAGDDASHVDMLSSAEIPTRRREFNTGSVAGSGAASPIRSRRAGVVGERSPDEEVKQYCRSGAEMLRGAEDRVAPTWSSLRTKSPSRLGEEMLEEQAALDDRERLIRTVNNIHGEDMEFRGHVARNIRERLQDEFRREAGRGPALAVDQQCINIKKQLDSMAKARGELRGLRSKVQAFTDPEGDEPGQAELFAELGSGTKKKKAREVSVSESPRDRRSSSPAMRRSSTHFHEALNKTLEVPTAKR